MSVAMKDSRVPWIGNIPMTWEMRKVSRSFGLIGSGTTPSVANDAFHEEGTIPWVNTGDLNDGIVTETEKRLTSRAVQQHTTLRMYPPGTVLVAMYGATIGKVGVLGIEACTNQACCALARPKYFDTRFIYYWFLDNRRNLVALSYGGGQPNINQDLIRAFRVQAPSLSEQRRIAAYLDEATGKVDRLVALRRRQMELLREQRAALIQQAVTRGLNPRAPLKDSGNPCLPEIPAAWSSTKLKYLGKVISGFAFASGDFTDAGVRVLKIANIQTMRLDWSEESFVPAALYERHSSFAVVDGDLVFALTRPIISTGLKAAIAALQGERVLLNQRNAVFKPNKRVEREFLYYAVFSHYFAEDFESRIDATGQQPNISPVAVADIPIALPSLPEQHAIVRFIQGETTRLDRIQSAYTRQLELLAEYRASLIHECVTGQRVVGN